MFKIKNILGAFLFISVITLGAMVVNPITVYAGSNGVGCEVDIVLDAQPIDDTEFTFNPMPGDEFVLVETGERFKTIIVPQGGSLQVTEVVPEDWTLVEIDCGSRGLLDIVLIENGIFLESCEDGEAVCNFVNELEVRPIPTLSQWGLIATAAVLGIVGVVVYSRRKAAA